jgi:predicted helicase
VRGRGFERLCRWILENAPEYAAKVEKVWFWHEWPGRGGRRDAGIDLVARERDGGLWAVQAKHYDPAYAIKKADLDSFLSESSRAEFSYRLLIATTDHLGPTARRTLDGQEKPVGTLLRSDLAALDLPWPRSLTALRPVRPKPKRPRPHQRRAVKEILSGLETNERGQVVMACGTGKTLVARFLHDQVASRRTLVLVPSLSLLKQSLREWLLVGPFDYLAVCSDDTVAPDDTDAMVSTTTELGVPVTTDTAMIAAFLRKRGTRVVFATYQSSRRIAEAQTGGVPRFDLVVADEAHRCAGPQAGVFATVLDTRRIKAAQRVFMTATPRYFTGRVQHEAKEADWEVASMDDKEKFGPVLHRLSFAQAIDQDLLSDYQVVVVGVTDESYRDLAERGVFVTTDGEAITDARTLARQIGLLRAMRKHDLHRVVSFHSRIASASRFASRVLEVAAWMPRSRRPTGRLWAEHVSGKMTSGERETKLNRLRAVGEGERGLLTKAHCLAEGVDVPALDGVAFIDPRRSQVDVVQAVGRAIRKVDDKMLGTIVIPVLIDENSDPEEALASSDFRPRLGDCSRPARSRRGSC